MVKLGRTSPPLCAPASLRSVCQIMALPLPPVCLNCVFPVGMLNQSERWRGSLQLEQPPGAVNTTRAMSYRAWFQCINPQCGATYPLNSIIYHCTKCHALLEVQHDLKQLKLRDAKGWMKLFEDRYKSNAMAVRLRRLGQEGMGSARNRGRQHRLALRGRHKSVLGRTLRQNDRTWTTSGSNFAATRIAARSRTSA